MTAHNDSDIDATEGPYVEVDTRESVGIKGGRRDEAGRMVVLHEVVVDGLWRMHETAGTGSARAQQVESSGRVVATDVDEAPRVVALQSIEDRRGCGGVGLVAGGAERSARRVAEPNQIAFAQWTSGLPHASQEALDAASGA